MPTTGVKTRVTIYKLDKKVILQKNKLDVEAVLDQKRKSANNKGLNIHLRPINHHTLMIQENLQFSSEANLTQKWTKNYLPIEKKPCLR